ncbi:MAG TPA: PilT/PilU family type 4a pilus ATPase, partial [Mycobacteriales bacterium]|nr:PilT/PilU family type 4a pilus ATPase [Mycobacteriales bacterium]
METQDTEGTPFAASTLPPVDSSWPAPSAPSVGLAAGLDPATDVPTTGYDPTYGAYAPAIPAGSPGAAAVTPVAAAAAPAPPASAPPPTNAAAPPVAPPAPSAPTFDSFAPAVPAGSPGAATLPPPPPPAGFSYDPTPPSSATAPPSTGSGVYAAEPPEESADASVEKDTAYARAALEEDSKFEATLLADLLVAVQDSGASDLHLSSGARPTLRIHGSLAPMEDQPLLTPPVIQRMLYAILTQKQREHFEEELELDFAYALPGRARFRVNIYKQRDSLGGAFRIIPYEIKSLEDLGVPPSVANFAMLPRGFVLVTGPTGSGKSTTLAAIVDLANRSRKDHIMTVEDPIEFLHRHKSCLVNQREVGEDTWSFQNALKHVLRQDPDIILVGEMRDLETISVALTAAETGHLVFATLHTQDAAQTIDRVIDVFPPHQQQ